MTAEYYHNPRKNQLAHSAFARIFVVYGYDYPVTETIYEQVFRNKIDNTI
jgi:hypothetical protein